MRPEVFKRAVIAVLLISGIYAMARVLDWTGPHSNVQFEPLLLWPGVFIISLWGLSRLFKGSAS
jgi:hypothetical protein